MDITLGDSEDMKNKGDTGMARENSERQQRRVSRIVHDDRGNATVEWVTLRDERDELTRDRVALSIVEEDTAGRAWDPSRTGRGFNPYQRAGTSRKDESPTTRTRTDLRKLSEWIKLTREMEARKLRGETED